MAHRKQVSRPLRSTFVSLLFLLLVSPAAAQTGKDLPRLRSQLETWYAENTAAYMRKDLPAIMALRASDFHSITPDGRVNDYAGMKNYIEGLLNGIQKWNDLRFALDSVQVSANGDTAQAIVKQYVDRIALRPDNQYHHVQTWVTQRETWVKRNGKWLMWRVDQLRDQRRLIDGMIQGR
jgi:ketosteroid isomerase-like protein